MKEYNKNAKLFYCIFGIISFISIICAIAYMTQYQNLFLFEGVNGIQATINADNLNNNTSWSSFISNNVGAMETLGFANSGTNMLSIFAETSNTIYGVYQELQVVNHLLLWLGVVGLVVFAFALVMSNGSRRIYYKSNLIVGIITPAVAIVFALVVFIVNTSVFNSINSNLPLLQAMDYAVENGVTSYTASIEAIQSASSINIATLVIIDIFLAIFIGYSVFLMVYAIRRYQGCKTERDEIMKKAVQLNEQ